MTIIDYQGKKGVYHEGHPNSLLSITPVQHFAIRYTDSESRERMALIVAFGKSNDDGGVGLWLLAGEDQMTDQLRALPRHLLKQVREALSESYGVDDPEEADVSGLEDLPDMSEEKA